jgi:hypothetical protein
MPDRLTRAYYYTWLAAGLACFASLVVFLIVAAPGFNVSSDRAKVDRILNPAVAVSIEASRAG